MRIALAGFVHETNTFAPFPTTLADFSGFDGAGLARGEDVLRKTPPKVSLQGFAAAARAAGHELVPIVHAHAQPLAHVQEEAFESICREIVEGLRASACDAVFLELHGAMVAAHIPDPDTEILRRVRDAVGREVPVAVTLDSHGNVNEELVALADALVAYRTYPHIDMYETGERAFRLLQPLLAGGRPHARAWRALPFLMPINLQTTMAQPCQGLYERLAQLEREAGGEVCLSFMTGFPLADVPQCRPTVFGYGSDASQVQAAVDALHAAVCACEDRFAVQLPGADEAVARALAQGSGRTVMADVQDNAGGGATSDTAWIIESLVDAGATGAVVGLVFDEDVAAQAHRAGVGARLQARVGGKLMPGHASRELAWTVRGLHEGAFDLKGPMLAGGTLDLGRMAWLQHEGVSVVVTSRRTWYVERECFRACGAAPEDFRIVVVKSTNHYRADFTSIADRIIEFAAPAAVAMDPSTLPYRHLQPGLRLHGGGPAFQPPGHASSLRAGEPFTWLNPHQRPGVPPPKFGAQDVLAARDRLQRFAPLLRELFPELGASDGIIESPVVAVPRLQQALAIPRSAGTMLVKADHLLPVAGSIKARGGVHEVLEFAEGVALRHGLLAPGESYAVLGGPGAREVFGGYTVAVGSTGNLGLSIGVMAAKLGFRTAVHMSSDAKEWKKARLRDLGVTVVEHPGDYQQAVAAGRRQAADDPRTHFVDDEHSPSLLLGYAAAVPHLLTQLEAAGVRIDERHPLFVYLPCGVGGAPGGITLGLALFAHPNVHCFFAEPVQSPCFAVKCLEEPGIQSVYDFGLTNQTEADGLAVPQASDLAAEVVAPVLSGGYTVTDAELFRLVARAHREEGLALEPSAAAGFAGPCAVLRSAPGRHYLARNGLEASLRDATHLVWTTGGSFVPKARFEEFLQRAAEVE